MKSKPSTDHPENVHESGQGASMNPGTPVLVFREFRGRVLKGKAPLGMVVVEYSTPGGGKVVARVSLTDVQVRQ
jgi:hypothetical protein